jgi:hypothetical protein
MDPNVDRQNVQISSLQSEKLRRLIMRLLHSKLSQLKRVGGKNKCVIIILLNHYIQQK